MRSETSNSIIEKLERDRALAVIAKAERTGENVVETLVSHMVSKSLIEELTGETVDFDRRQPKINRSDIIREWAVGHVGETMTTQSIADGLGVSLGSATKYVKEYTDFFVRVKRGHYTIRNGEQERVEARQNK